MRCMCLGDLLKQHAILYPSFTQGKIMIPNSGNFELKVHVCSNYNAIRRYNDISVITQGEEHYSYNHQIISVLSDNSCTPCCHCLSS